MKFQLRPIEPRDIMRYYVAYYDIEKDIIELINPTKEATLRHKAFYRYVNNYMKIGRNFKSKKAAEILQILDEIQKNDFVSSVEELSNKIVLNKLVSRPQILNVKVAASKLIWLFNNKTIIMDNNNMKVLGAINYQDFVSKWRTQYALKKEEIISVTKEFIKNYDSIINEDWFQMRVFDMYLLSVFSEKQLKYKYFELANF